MKREAFRAKIEKELISYGYAKDSFIWQQNPARFVIAIAGGFRTLPIKATMRKERLAYELGRLKGWAEIMQLVPFENVSRAKPPVNGREMAGAAA